MSQATRRLFLTALAGGASLVGGRKGRSEPIADHVRRFGMVIDLDQCVNCGACTMACAIENNVPLVDPKAELRARPIHWMDLLSPAAEGDGDLPLGEKPAPIPCMHCQDAPCVQICPVGATYMTSDGIVAQIWDRCIGCRACMVACPYSRRYYNFATPTWPPCAEASLNPEVALRPKGIVEKCTFCHHRIRDTLLRKRLADESVVDGDLRQLPACARVCPAEAITFGDLNDPNSQVAQLARSPRALRLLENLGTHPKVIYLQGRR